MRLRPLFLSAALLFLLPQLSLAQKSGTAKVDSTFRKHFASIGRRAGTDKPLKQTDLYFIQVLGSLSGKKEYTVCYGSMTLTDANFQQYRKWYAVHRSQITWDNLQRGFSLMRVSLDVLNSDTFNIAEARRIKALESLRIN